MTKDYLEKFDRVFGSGHMTIYRNSQQMNTLFMREDARKDLIYRNYKQIFQASDNQAFDEMLPDKVNINYLAHQAGIRQSNDCFAVDVAPFCSLFEESLFYPCELRWDTAKEHKDFILLWESGTLAKVENENGKKSYSCMGR